MSRPVTSRLSAGAASALALILAVLVPALTPAPARAQSEPTTYTQTRTSSFSYLPNGLLQTETIEPDKPQLCVLSTHIYDDYGNKKGVSTENCANASGLARFDKRQSQSDREAYTASTPAGNIAAPRGTLVTASKVALTGNLADAGSQGESRQQDPRFSVTTTLTGPNGLTTNWQLDEFGRKVLDQRSDCRQRLKAALAQLGPDEIPPGVDVNGNIARSQSSRPP